MSIQFLRIIIISVLIFVVSGCELSRDDIYYEVVDVSGLVTSFSTNSKYVRVCLNLSSYERDDVESYVLSPMTSGVLERDEFLFYINSTGEYPNLGVIAGNGDCFFAENIFVSDSFVLDFVNENVSGQFFVTHYNSYVLFIQDKYDDIQPSNSLKNVYVNAPVMERDTNRGELSVLDPIPQLHPVRVKIRGGYGRSSPKKSYSVHFLEETNILGVEGRILYLQSQFNDPNLVRNYVSLKLYESLGYVAPQIEFVNVFMNERYIGVYELSNRIDKDLLGFDFALNDPTRVYKINFYGGDCSLASSIQTDMKMCRDEFVLDVDQAIDYYLLIKVTGATDNIGKNYFISVDEFETALIIPWDLDYTFHRISVEQKLVGFTGNDYLYPVIADSVDRVVDRYYELRSSVWSDDSLVEIVNKTVELDSTLNYDVYVFPERLPHVDLVDVILRRVAFLDEDFESVVLNDLVE